MKSKTKIYFSLNMGVNAGLADRLSAWSSLYHLGRSMDWIYIHRPLRAARSDRDNNIFDFLGFNKLWEESGPRDAGIHFAKAIRVPINLNDLGVEVHSSKDVQNWLAHQVRRRRRISGLRLFLPWQWGRLYRGCVSGSRGEGGNKILVLLDQKSWWYRDLSGAAQFVRNFLRRLLRFSHRKGLWQKPVALESREWRKYIPFLIKSTKREMSLSLRRAYDEARMRSPWPSGFESGKVKMLVHVRQGDAGVVRTPWGKFIVCTPACTLTDRLDDLPQDMRSWSEPSEIFSFLKELVTRIGHEQLSVITASDGYRRTFNTIRLCQRSQPFLSDIQLKTLERMEDGYEEKQFSRFFEISRTCIGESDENLRHLVDGLMRADIVVANMAGTTSRVLLDMYRACDKPPPLLLLLGRQREYSQFLSRGRKVSRNVLVVNIADPDFDLTEMRVRERIAGLKHEGEN